MLQNFEFGLCFKRTVLCWDMLYTQVNEHGMLKQASSEQLVLDLLDTYGAV